MHYVCTMHSQKVMGTQSMPSNEHAHAHAHAEFTHKT
jgi:hypothetical protein